jgi:GNAT superfamily N-acetyltransferase
VAEEGGEVIGLVALKKQPDCLELCGLGVDPRFERKGVGKALVEARAEARGDVCLVAVIPGPALNEGHLSTAWKRNQSARERPPSFWPEA